VLLVPVRMFPDPFRGAPNILVLCECVAPDMVPIPTNTRRAAYEAFEKKKGEVPWFGLEQEYTLFHADKVTPLGWPKGGYPGPQGPYYCSVGTENAFGRLVMEAHYKCCLYAGVKISGVNGEVLPGQWEYQIGPCTGIESGDHSWMARFLMYRVAEDFGVCVSFDPKPIPGDWNGSGMHSNFSTQTMREEGGYTAIIAAVEKLGLKHKEHIAAYGEGNERRLTGKHETASINKFGYGVADRGKSIRIPRDAEREKKGYFEDSECCVGGGVCRTPHVLSFRAHYLPSSMPPFFNPNTHAHTFFTPPPLPFLSGRPAANADPYVVTAMIFKTTCLE
jgi:glutamine synthetase